MTVRRRVITWVIIAAAAWVLFWVIPGLLVFYTDWLWFGEVGYRLIFWKILLTKVFLGLIFGLAFFLLLFGNVALARRLAPRATWYEQERRFRQEVAEFMEFYVGRYLYITAVIVLLLLSWAVAKGASDQWQKALLFLHPTRFAATDPIFGRDLGFYVFRLPFWQYIWQWLFLSLLAALVVSAAVHYFDKAIRMLRGIPAFAPHVKAHLSVILAALLFAKAWGYQLSAWGLLYSQRGRFFGATYADAHAHLLGYRVLIVTALVCGLVVLVNLRYRGLWLPLAGIGVLALFSVLMSGIFPALVQRLQVLPNEFDREKPYIKYHVKFTRQAYHFHDAGERQFPSLATLTRQTIAKNPETVLNARLWDYRLLKTTYQKQQELQPYYGFLEMDLDRYRINGDYRQVLLSARELQVADLPGKGWQNEHIYYTHGYGLALSPVNEGTATGLPLYFVRDIPLSVTSPSLRVQRPGIYYGEGAREEDYAIVKTEDEENDYPIGEENAKTRYTGKGGVPLRGRLTRLAMLTRFRNVNIYLSKLITQESRIIFRSNIRTRLHAIAPFLRFSLLRDGDEDPYLVIGEDGHIYWIQDLYTISDHFPYAQPIRAGPGEFNYVRNSVKAVTDAYDGTVAFYVFEPGDPVLRAYQKIFPGVFLPKEKMPGGLLRHIRYPEALFEAQAFLYTSYHMTDPRAFFNQVDRWDLAREARGKAVGRRAGEPEAPAGGGQTMEAYYTVMRLPGEKLAEFVLMIPFTPQGKTNMTAWMCGRCDPPNYGKLVIYEFPRGQQVWGPIQVEGKINQDPYISERRTWWGEAGSEFKQGNLLVLPLGDSILYVEPVYLVAQEGAIPELKQVIVARQTRDTAQVEMRDTFELALQALVGEAPTPPQAKAAAPPREAAPSAAVAAPPKELADLAARALQHYQKAQDRLQAGDWSAYGREQEELGRLLEELAKKRSPGL
jgi:hypothetical protein